MLAMPVGLTRPRDEREDEQHQIHWLLQDRCLVWRAALGHGDLDADGVEHLVQEPRAHRLAVDDEDHGVAQIGGAMTSCSAKGGVFGQAHRPRADRSSRWHRESLSFHRCCG